VVPPQGRNEHGVSGTHLGHVRRRQCLANLGVPCKVGIAQRHQAHRRAGGCEVQRTDIKVCYLLGRKQRETAAPRDHAADVVPFIDVGGSGDLIAQPDPGQYVGIDDAQAILLGKARQAIADERALSRNGRRLGELRIAQDLLGNGRERQAVAQKVESRHVLVVEKLAVDFRRGQQRVHRFAAVEAAEVADQGRRRVEALLHGGPIPNEPAQDDGALVGEHIAPNGRGVESRQFKDGARRRRGSHQR